MNGSGFGDRKERSCHAAIFSIPNPNLAIVTAGSDQLVNRVRAERVNPIVVAGEFPNLFAVGRLVLMDSFIATCRKNLIFRQNLDAKNIATKSSNCSNFFGIT